MKSERGGSVHNGPEDWGKRNPVALEIQATAVTLWTLAEGGRQA